MNRRTKPSGGNIGVASKLLIVVLTAVAMAAVVIISAAARSGDVTTQMSASANASASATATADVVERGAVPQPSPSDAEPPAATVIATGTQIGVRGPGFSTAILTWEESCYRRMCAGTETVAVRPGSTLERTVIARRSGPAWGDGPCAGRITLLVTEDLTGTAAPATGDPPTTPVDTGSCTPVWSPDGEALAWTRVKAPMISPISATVELVVAPVPETPGVVGVDVADGLTTGTGVAGEHIRVIDWVWTSEDDGVQTGYLVLQSIGDNWIRLWTRGVERDREGRFSLSPVAEPFPQADLITVDAQPGDDGSTFYALAIADRWPTLRIGGVPEARSTIILPRQVIDYLHPELAWVNAVGTSVLVGDGIGRAWLVDATVGSAEQIAGPESGPWVIHADLIAGR